MTVKDLSVLRKQLKANGAQLMVAKKTLLKRALDEKGIELNISDMEGEIAAVFSFEDALAPVKNLNDFGKTNEHVQIRGGYMDNNVLTVADVKQLAALPGKDVLRGQLVGVIASPLSGFANVLQGNIKGLITVLSEKAKA